MPRARTGTAVYVEAKPGEARGHYRIRVTANDGSRPWFDLDPGPKSPQAEARARETAAAYSEDVRRKGLGAATPRRARRGASSSTTSAAGETVTAYAARWLADREARGYTSVRTDRARFTQWVAPMLGDKPIASAAVLDVERLVEDLDARVLRGELAWKTAQNAWGLVTKLFDDARRSKVLGLRVRSDNPAAEVRGPDRGATKAKVFVYPSELARLGSCDDVPASWRRLFVVATYLYLRAAELRGLRWEDLDLEHRRAHVHRTVNEAGEEGTTKGEAGRLVPIEASLVPLLEAMRAEGGGDGHVFPEMPREGYLASALRGYLERSGVTRTELFTTTRTRRQLRFHDLRATGITWRAVRGDDALKIMQAAGHTEFSTTMGYVRTAELVRGDFGDVFPEVPAALRGGVAKRPARAAVEASNRPANRLSRPKSAERLCEEGDLNPGGMSRSATNKGDPRTGNAATSPARDAQVPDRSSAGTLPDDSPASVDPVEASLAGALDRASAAGRWDVVAQLARELEARRLASTPNVVSLDAAERRRS